MRATPINEGAWYRDRVDELAIVVGDGEQLYAAPLDAATVGVFRRTSTELFIHAVASNEPDSTFIAYEPPIRALVYPLVDGGAFSSTSEGSGTFEGNIVPYCSTDTYESTVSGRGVVRTAAGDFPAQRVLTRQQVDIYNCFDLTQTTLLRVEHRQVVFLSACTGAVVSVTSAEGADDFAFETASRVRLVGLP